MLLHRSQIAIFLCGVGLTAVGCNLFGPRRQNDLELEHYKTVARTISHPDMTAAPKEETILTPAPHTALTMPKEEDYWNLTLDELVQIAVTRSSVMRDLGGLVVRAPDSARTIVGPALAGTDPRFGMEAALSEFDATLSSSAFFEKNDRMINNFIASGGGRLFRQDLHVYRSQLSKTGAAGTRMTLRGTSTYDANNASFNKFTSAWDSLLDLEVRQPLLQGGGVNFNRIAGPNSVPGLYNGVVIARVNTDISLVDFEMGMRDLISNVDNAYWDLYYAYRDLDAKVNARNAAIETWRRVKRMLEAGQAGVTSEREAQAREQYFRFEEEVQNSLSGKQSDATTNNNGSSGGSFRGAGGVLVAERRLRLAVGLPISDGRMIRPAEEPTFAFVVFPWEDLVQDALSRRPELQRQRLVVKRRELELIASRNFLLPQFDMVSRYRFRGLGKNLIGDATGVPPDPADPMGYFQRSSLDNLFGGDFQEWQLGGELVFPVGFRRGYAALRHAQLQVVRDRSVLEEQERTVIHDLSNALADVHRSYQLMQTTYNRRAAAQEQVDILRTKLDERLQVSFDQLLDAERRLSDADVQFHRARVEYMLALKNVHFEKGTLLEYCRVHLADRIPPADLAVPHGKHLQTPPTQEVLPPASAEPAQPPAMDPAPKAEEIMPPAQEAKPVPNRGAPPLIPPPPPKFPEPQRPPEQLPPGDEARQPASPSPVRQASLTVPASTMLTPPQSATPAAYQSPLPPLESDRPGVVRLPKPPE